MRIITFRTEEITVQDLIAVRCDLCGITTNDNPSWSAASQNHNENECLIALRQGTRESGDVTSFDVCPDCWHALLVPWMKSQGAEPSNTHWGG